MFRSRFRNHSVRSNKRIFGYFLDVAATSPDSGEDSQNEKRPRNFRFAAFFPTDVPT
jgi:hypothetical protein